MIFILTIGLMLLLLLVCRWLWPRGLSLGGGRPYSGSSSIFR